MKTNKKKLSFSPFLIFSIFIHLTVFVFIQQHSLWFFSPIKEKKITENKSILPKKEKEKILKQFIAHISSKPSSKKKEKQVITPSFTQPLFDEKRNITSPDIKISSEYASSLKLEENDKSLPSFINLFSVNKQLHLKTIKDKTNFSPVKYFAKPDKKLKKEIEEEREYGFKNMLSLNEPKTSQSKFLLENDNHQLPVKLQTAKSNFLKKTNLAKNLTFPTLRDLKTYLYADDFDIDVSHTKAKEGGYIFAITLIPKPNIDLPRIPQHYTLLIDRSNSIQKNRLKSSRDALYQAISFLKEEDSFNVIAFDNKMEKLFPSKRRLSDDSKKQARKFLMNLKLGSFFAPSNIYNPLYSSVYDKSDESHIHSIILLSNGDGLTSKSLQHHFMRQWTDFNKGKTSLFSISMENDKQLADLEIISTLNRGWLATSSTKGGLKRKVMKLMKTIQNPIIKDVECSYISTTGNNFELFRPYKGLPHLYAAEPYVVIGRCDKLEDFTLVLQGKNKDKWLNIKKNICLKSSKKADRVLLEQWALHKAWNYYSEYLKELNTNFLEKAKKVLEPFDIPPAFE